MNEETRVRVQRRTRSEIKDVVAQFAESGLNQSEFCRRHGVCMGTLRRHLRRLHQGTMDTANGGLLAVELAGSKFASQGCALALVLSERRRIEVSAGFDGRTLERLVMLLEKL